MCYDRHRRGPRDHPHVVGHRSNSCIALEKPPFEVGSTKIHQDKFTSYHQLHLALAFPTKMVPPIVLCMYTLRICYYNAAEDRMFAR